MGVEWEEADDVLIHLAERLIDEHHPQWCRRFLMVAKRRHGG